MEKAPNFSESSFENVRNQELKKLDQNIEHVLHSSKTDKFKESDFKDVYSGQKIAEDLTRTAQLKQVFHEKKRLTLEKSKHDWRGHQEAQEKDAQEIERIEKLARCLEILVVKHGDDWFGPGCKTTLTSETDDILHGVDAVTEFDPQNLPPTPEQNSRPHLLGLSLDATTSSFNAESKFKKNIERIEDKKAFIEYFKSSYTDYKGKVDYIVPIVLALGRENVERLVNLEAEYENLKNKESKNSIEEAGLKILEQKMKNHPCQMEFLQQKKHQLEIYLEFFDSKNDDYAQEYKLEIKRFYEHICDSLNEKKSQGIKEAWNYDQASSKIKNLSLSTLK